MDLIGEKVILENGEITEILAHDDNILIQELHQTVF